LIMKDLQKASLHCSSRTQGDEQRLFAFFYRFVSIFPQRRH
jgi:hypothetical protein